MRAAAEKCGAGAFGLACAAKANRMRQGGNQWSGWTAYLSFFRHVANLDIDYSKYAHWEAATIYGGPRWVHEKFCIVSDRPEFLKVDDQTRPHCEEGPFCRWRDGSALYAWHGIYVPANWIENKTALDPRTALTHENLELRRAAAEIVGWARVLEHVKARVIDEDHPAIGTLLEADLPDSPGERFLRVRCATGRDFVLLAPKEATTAYEANLAMYFSDEDSAKLSPTKREAVRKAMIEERT
jgi:hypothetical protein